MKNNTKTKSANGLTGILIRSGGDYYFRVTDKTTVDGFVDYRLDHNDVTVTIKDEDAFIYESDSCPRLDHSPATLGYTNG